jgi:N-formylglutamate deformylase
MKLPLYISVPHAGTDVPSEVRSLCALRREDILADRDAGADLIYFPLQKYVAGFTRTDIARSLIDLNRAPDDIGGNGVIKSHTCWKVPVYRTFPPKKMIQTLLDRYYFPYHAKLSAGGNSSSTRLGVDCHTMAAVGPPVGPDPGKKRPLVCLSNCHGTTCPEEWLHCMASCLQAAFGEPVTINNPFSGGFISRLHAAEMPWVQIEISQTAAFPDNVKRDCLLEGLQSFCHTVFRNA